MKHRMLCESAQGSSGKARTIAGGMRSEETDNLTEVEVVDIEPAQMVTIVPDAIPELTLQGKVESISQVFEEKNGDITYTTKILLVAYDSRLRWGMTVLVTFQK
jgi:hypothetical protein